MEAIAKEAGLAKATAYAYLEDKEAVFLGVCKRVAVQVIERAEQAAEANVPVAERVSAVLLAKFRLVFDLVYGTAHAREILETTDAHARKLFEDTDARFLRVL